MKTINENNKVFELIDYLFNNIEKIKTYQKWILTSSKIIKQKKYKWR